MLLLKLLIWKLMSWRCLKILMAVIQDSVSNCTELVAATIFSIARSVVCVIVYAYFKIVLYFITSLFCALICSFQFWEASCYTTDLRNNHLCVENSMKNQCPICYEVCLFLTYFVFGCVLELMLIHSIASICLIRSTSQLLWNVDTQRIVTAFRRR